jgi:hypothetical protein
MVPKARSLNINILGCLNDFDAMVLASEFSGDYEWVGSGVSAL